MARSATAVLLLLATWTVCYAHVEDILVEETNDQIEGIKMSDINPEEGFLEDSEAKGYKPGSMKKILESIQNLRAYCLLAYDKAIDFKKTNSGNSALVNFITFFGKPAKKKKPMNIVLGFATAIGKAKGMFSGGINNYLLMHLGKAVFEGKKAVSSRKVSGKSMVRLSAKKMGLMSVPRYFNKLAVPLMKLATTEQEVIEASSDADSQAAAQWLASGSKAKYKSFKEMEEEAVSKKVEHYKNDVYMNALKAIKNSWDNSHSLQPLPISGTKGGAKVPAVKVPSPEDVDKAAKKAAKEWLKRHSERKRAAEEAAMKKAQELAEKKAAEKKAKKEVVDKEKAKKKKEQDTKEKATKKKEEEKKQKKAEAEKKKEMDAKEKKQKKEEKAAKEEKKEKDAKEKKKEKDMKEKAEKETKKEKDMKEKAAKEEEKKKEKDMKEKAEKEKKKEKDMKEKAEKETQKENAVKAAEAAKKEKAEKERAQENSVKAAAAAKKQGYLWKNVFSADATCSNKCGQSKKTYVSKSECRRLKMDGQIKATHGKCLDASQRNRNGGKVHMWDCNTGNKNQQWTFNMRTTAADKVSNSKCSGSNTPLKRICPATEACYVWSADHVRQACPTKCGEGARTLKGRIYCMQSGSERSADKCDSTKKPAAQTKHCPATKPCPVYGECCCKIDIYKHTHLRGHIGSYNTCHHTKSHWGYYDWTLSSSQNNNVDSIRMNGHCIKYKVLDDDEEELIQTSVSKSVQNVMYYSDKNELPYDLSEDVKGIHIYPKNGCCKKNCRI